MELASQLILKETFEELDIDLLKKTMVPVTQVLKDAKVSKSQVGQVILMEGPQLEFLRSSQYFLSDVLLPRASPLSLGIETARGVTEDQMWSHNSCKEKPDILNQHMQMIK